MSKVEYSIEILSDKENRLNEIPVKVMIKNLSEEKVKVLNIVPNIPNNVDLEEKVDTFQEESKLKFNDLCQELSMIISNILLISNSEHKENLINTWKKIYQELFKSLPSLYKMILFNQSALRSRLNNLNKQLSRLRYKVNSIDDAKWAYEKWVKDLDDNNPEKKLYEGKLKQLEGLSINIDQKNSNYIALIEPDSFYSRTYVLRFSRKTLSTKVYNLSFDSTYESDDSTQEYRANVSTSINITPKPFFLTVFTALSSILGTILKYCINNLNEDILPYEFFIKLGKLIVTAPGITSLIIAILFFNIYEYTDMGKRLTIKANWRSALTIGILAGLLGERLIDAIKVLVGLS